MTAIEIVRASDPTTREAAFAIREAVFVREQGVDLALEFDGLDEDAEHLLARLEGRAVGTLRIRLIDRSPAKIERVAVLEDARGHAVGATLMRAALDRLRALGIAEVKVHAQTHALAFYERLGFAAFGEVFDEDGIPHKAMVLDLTAERAPAGGG